jgi:hypothetical protein
MTKIKAALAVSISAQHLSVASPARRCSSDRRFGIVIVRRALDESPLKFKASKHYM